MAGLHPTKPGFVFRIGVVGHRWDKLGVAGADTARPADQATPSYLTATEPVERAIENAVSKLLTAIAGHLTPIALDPENGYATDKKPRLAVISGLAEGADRIVAKSGLAAGYELWAVYPFDPDRYRRDFDELWKPPFWSRRGAAVEFDRLRERATASVVMDGIPDRYDGYEALGRTVLNHSDVLIAIWDGDPARGPGGTANLLRDARRDEVPIIRIDPTDPSRVWLEDMRDRDEEGVGAGLAPLWTRLNELVKPPERCGLVGSHEWNGRLTFFAEEQIAGHCGKAYQAMQSFFLARRHWLTRSLLPTAPVWLGAIGQLFRRSLPRNFEDHARVEWTTRWRGALAGSPGFADRVVDNLAPIHGWLDQLATYYSDRHRSAFTVVFSLAWMAAVAAVAALVAHHFAWPVAGLLSGIELGVILAILGMTIWGKIRKFHERWIDYRLVEQRIRHLAFLWPLGAATTGIRMSVKPSGDDPRVSWTAWLYRAFVRQLGFGATRFDEAHLETCRRILREGEIPEQRLYHDLSAKRFRDLHHAVHQRTEWLFIAAALVASLHLLGAPHWIAEWLGHADEKVIHHRELVVGSILTLFSVFLPARAAALHGWAGHADFHGAALRSAEIELRLEELERSIDTLVAVNSTTLGEAGIAAARAMEIELGAWRATSLSRPLERV